MRIDDREQLELALITTNLSITNPACINLHPSTQ